jgi:hypothetical protein
MEGGGAAEPISAIITYLLSFGLPGVIIIALGFAYWRKDARVSELQDTLVEVSVQSAKAMGENAAAINGLRELLIMRGARAE